VAADDIVTFANLGFGARALAQTRPASALAANREMCRRARPLCAFSELTPPMLRRRRFGAPGDIPCSNAH